MNTHNSNNSAADLLLDAVLREHARLGNEADEFLLAKIQQQIRPPARK